MINKTPAWLSTLKFIGLSVWLILTLFPLYWIIITSFKGPGAIAAYPVKYWPSNATLENYQSLFSKSQFGDNMVNSLTVSLAAGAVSTVIALFSSYILSRFHFRGRGGVMIAFLITQMIPAFIALGPLYQMMVKLGLSDSRPGLVLVYIAMCIPFASIMLKGFFDNVPIDIEEAALVDGCNRMSALWRVLVPVMGPGIIATFIFNFVNCWNELFLSVTLINTAEKRTIPTALNSFISSFNIEWGPMSAAAVLTVIPTMVLFGIASKWIVSGLTAGATKG